MAFNSFLFSYLIEPVLFFICNWLPHRKCNETENYFLSSDFYGYHGNVFTASFWDIKIPNINKRKSVLVNWRHLQDWKITFFIFSFFFFVDNLRFFGMNINLAFCCPFLCSKLNLWSLGTWSKTHWSQMRVVPSNSVALDRVLEAYI